MDGEKLTKRCGTTGYTAPEILMNKPYSLPIDIFSFGVLIYKLKAGETPFPRIETVTPQKVTQAYQIGPIFKGK